MNRNLRLAMLAALAALCSVGCTNSVDPNPYALSQTHPDNPPVDASKVDLLAAADFQFMFTEGGFGWVDELLRIDADGTAILFSRRIRFDDQPGPRKFSILRGRVSPETLLELRQLLTKTGFLKMNRLYAANIMDGDQWDMRVRASGIEKSVYCSNYFPAGVRALKDQSEKIIAAMLAQGFKMSDFQWVSDDQRIAETANLRR